jgi:hypothetical protein
MSRGHYGEVSYWTYRFYSRAPFTFSSHRLQNSYRGMPPLICIKNGPAC